MSTRNLTPIQYARLVRLSRKLSDVLELDAIPKRDAVTGAFTKVGTVTAPALRAAWGQTGKRGTSRAQETFKTQLLAALRAPRK